MLALAQAQGARSRLIVRDATGRGSFYRSAQISSLGVLLPACRGVT
jgi:hypothetical protein